MVLATVEAAPKIGSFSPVLVPTSDATSAPNFAVPLTAPTVPFKIVGATAETRVASTPTLNLFVILLIASSRPVNPVSWSVDVKPPSIKSPIVVIPSVATAASARPAAAWKTS